MFDREAWGLQGFLQALSSYDRHTCKQLYWCDSEDKVWQGQASYDGQDVEHLACELDEFTAIQDMIDPAQEMEKTIHRLLLIH